MCTGQLSVSPAFCHITSCTDKYVHPLAQERCTKLEEEDVKTQVEGEVEVEGEVQEAVEVEVEEQVEGEVKIEGELEEEGRRRGRRSRGRRSRDRSRGC